MYAAIAVLIAAVILWALRERSTDRNCKCKRRVV
jgi:hypothetical protein